MLMYSIDVEKCRFNFSENKILRKNVSLIKYRNESLNHTMIIIILFNLFEINVSNLC